MTAYTVYADEAWTHEPEHRFWRFYGGALLRSSERPRIENELLALKAQRGLHGEIKWSLTTPARAERFGALVDRFLDFVEYGDVKLRYMWLDQRRQDTTALSEWHREYGFYILYYYFVVFGFGLPWHNERDAVGIEFFPDTLPDEPQKRREFRDFLLRAHNARRFRQRAPFRVTNVAAVDSTKHIILQCVDVIIGAVGYKLNKQYKAKRGGKRSRSSVAKIELWERILDRLGAIDMGERGTRSFAVGVNTGTGPEALNRWQHKFRQWDFRVPGAFNPNWERD
jgi:hypothetical protein